MLYFLTDSRFTIVGEWFFAYSKVIQVQCFLVNILIERDRVEFSWQYFLLYIYALMIVEIIILYHKTVDILNSLVLLIRKRIIF